MIKHFPLLLCCSCQRRCRWLSRTMTREMWCGMKDGEMPTAAAGWSGVRGEVYRWQTASLPATCVVLCVWVCVVVMIPGTSTHTDRRSINHARTAALRISNTSLYPGSARPGLLRPCRRTCHVTDCWPRPLFSPWKCSGQFRYILMVTGQAGDWISWIIINWRWPVAWQESDVSLFQIIIHSFLFTNMFKMQSTQL